MSHDIAALRAAGATYREIARLTGLSLSQINYRLNLRPTSLPPHKSRRKGMQERACLCCGQAFPSEGPHNRLCGRCRSQSVGPFDTAHAVHYR